MDKNNWEKRLAVNTGAYIRGSLLALEHMRRDRGGRGGVIINVHLLQRRSVACRRFFCCPCCAGPSLGVCARMGRSKGRFTPSLCNPIRLASPRALTRRRASAARRAFAGIFFSGRGSKPLLSLTFPPFSLSFFLPLARVESLARFSVFSGESSSSNGRRRTVALAAGAGHIRYVEDKPRLKRPARKQIEMFYLYDQLREVSGAHVTDCDKGTKI
ncbi:hypothetical protein C0Q70_20103 [Pomacea canaliculata]|uniref:Uncharacterized protein n=1 Tax=Pomacea canaliculata TaxID=400727 RepID=A0A2T7NEK6_POMCA|nr:hypothetical protein C0Q70_20103 [Pomacea canaliculata]